MILLAAAAALISGMFLARTDCASEKKSLSDGDFTVEWLEMSPRHPTGPTVFIMAPTGGATILDRRFARGLCRQNRRVVMPVTWTRMNEFAYDLDLHNRLFARGSRALKLLAERYPGDLHFLGTSLGGLFTISALAHLPQIKKAVIVAGGVPFTDIIARSDTEAMTKLREGRFAQFNIRDVSDYIRRLENIFTWNDLDKITAEKMRDKELMLVIGMKDDGVPTANQLRLAEMWPGAKVIRHDSDHFATIVKSFLLDYYPIKRALK